MMFPEDSTYFPPPGGSVDTSVWKPHSHNDLSNHNSKLNTWAPHGSRGGNQASGNKGEFVYDDASAKAAWNNGGRSGGSTIAGDKQPMNAWGPPGPDPMSNEIALDQEFMHMNLSKPPEQAFGSHGGPQWGRQEVNQTTPWDVDANGMGRPPFGAPDGMPHGRGFMHQPREFANRGGRQRTDPVPVHFDNGGQWRQWDNDGFGNKSGTPDFNGTPFGGTHMPSQFGGHHGRINNFVPQQNFNDRMPFQMRNGPPFHHGGHHQPHQPWMDNKFGNGGHNQMHHPLVGPNNGGRFPFGHPGQQPPPHGGPGGMMMGGRPPLVSMQPPHPPHHPGAGGSGVPPSFAMGNYQSSVPNEDAMWQDPNGELRKWQRDTGTAHWGDPVKQNMTEIRRWIQPPTESDEENALAADPMREGKEEIETGWGPPPAPPGQKNNLPPLSISSNNASGWNEPPRGPPPQPANFAINPPNNFHQGPPGQPSNGWGAPPTGNAAGADWTRSGPLNAPGFQQPPMGGYDLQPGVHEQNEPRKIAEKLRLAVSKGLLDMNLLVNASSAFSNQAVAAGTLSLLNNMLERVQHLEGLEARVRQIEADQSRKPEFDRMQSEITEAKMELQDYRDQIHKALKGPSMVPGNPRVSLADELSAIDQPSQDIGTPLGDGVGQLW